MLARGDMPLGLNEFSLVGSDKKSRQILLDTIFMLGEGAAKAKDGADPAVRPVRLLYASTANTSLRQALELQGAREDAARDRMVTLDLSRRPKGIFSHLPEGFANYGELADSSKGATNEVWGAPSREFVRPLIAARASDAAEIVRRIDRSVKLVRALATEEGLQLPDRAAKLLGLAHAAGIYARRWGVIPKSWAKPRAAVRAALRCLDMPVVKTLRKPGEFALRRLKRYARKNAAGIPEGDQVAERLSAKAFKVAPGFWCVDGRSEVLVISAARFRHAFSDAEELARAMREAGLAHCDGGRSPKLTKKAPRGVCRDRSERAYFFVVPRPKRAGRASVARPRPSSSQRAGLRSDGAKGGLRPSVGGRRLSQRPQSVVTRW